jgi:uncharacterized damage-inducible protein DinB
VTVSTAVRPSAGEYQPYYDRYIGLVTETGALEALESQLADMLPLLRRLDESQGALRYAPGKWSVKQVLGHVLDTERVFAYRALRFARGDRTPLPGFDEKVYAESAGSDRRDIRALVEELEYLRRSTIAMFRGLDESAWTRRGIANDVEMSVRALAFVIAGHARHHMGILRERYLAGR